MKNEIGAIILFAVLLFGGLSAFTYWQASMESAAYNRLTGARTTTWDAIWLELRVQEEPQK